MKKFLNVLFLFALPLVVAVSPAFAGSGVIVSCPECSYSSKELVVGGGKRRFAIPFSHEVFYCDSSKEFLDLYSFLIPDWGLVMEGVAALPYGDEAGLAGALASLTDEDEKAHPQWAEFLEWYGRPDWQREDGSGQQDMTFGELREDLKNTAVQEGFGGALHSAACSGTLSPLADHEKPEAVCPVCGKGPVEVHDSGLMWD